MRAGASGTTWSAAGIGCLALVLLVACSSPSGGQVNAGSARAQPEGDGDDEGRAPSSGPAVTTEPASGSEADPTTSSSAADDGNGAVTGPAPSATDGLKAAGASKTGSDTTSQDRLAGVLSRDVPEVGDGVLHLVPGSSPAPGDGTVRRMRVSVEGGLPVDGAAFASFVLRTLNDARSWTQDGYTFARTNGAFDTEVLVTSPATSRAMCRPLETMGTLSCRNGDKVVLTWYRWVNGQEDFGDDLTAYRRYLVNHEVGHSLGQGHASCPRPGQLAPVMMQQTKGVKPCLPNAWPYP